MKTIRFPDGERVPALGQGTWRMGENKSARADEVEALRLGIDLGMTLIDTAEMYGDGGAEKVVADVIAGQRDRVFVVTKAYPHNASSTELPKACERSLKRLRIDVVDLYLLHWRGKNTPLAETVETFEKLRSAGKIRRWGVSNFDVEDMKELNDEILMTNDEEKRSACSANQVLYNFENRAVEFDLLPWSQKKKIPIMAYSPVGHGRGLLDNATLKKIAKRHDATSAQIALAWVLRAQGPPPPRHGVAVANVIAIPKASDKKHVRENAESAKIRLTKQDLQDLDDTFQPPQSKERLAML